MRKTRWARKFAGRDLLAMAGVSADQNVEELAQGLGSIGLNEYQSSERQPHMDEMDETDEFMIHCLSNREASARAMVNCDTA
jgi:hypothetical protein